MDRLTVRGKQNKNHVYIAAPVNGLCKIQPNFCPVAEECDKNTKMISDRKCPTLQLIDRLAEYEDTGLSPAEVAELKFKIERLRAKVIAYEKSGLFPDEVVELAQAKRDGRLVVLPCKVGDTAYYYIDDDELAGPYVGEFTVKGIQILSDGFYLSDGDCWDKIGTQFACLTREEAEKALKDGDAE